MYTGTTINDLIETTDRLTRPSYLGQCWYEDEFGQCANTATVYSLEYDFELCPRCFRRMCQ